ncbi:Bug family tripartite tricarboxylate transporter substrate binding protein [Bradyrhizobium manausense]|uniref:Bug family tripartite tricarboxylate transporter substrate binding protein n=1 Tax=Bradyrhizobium manausense TaxID=989370 RepID=UPI001BA7A185|nr:tripartite tricarboxylate transporter substrate binding protein [Bradyrhizobium manausense]MBR0723179.1 tripartite tricarboxylate transporter substrate binding protein [Bradyrhizobium manausense]
MLSPLLRALRNLSAAALCLAAASTAQADTQASTWPSRNITLVLPFAAGSGTDTTTRLISQHLSQALGVGIVIENKAGANGMIAATYVARAAPDGYTLLVTTNTTHSANPYLLKSLTYDPMKDFTPIARTGDLPFMLVVHPDVPAKTVAELVAYGKANPGKLSYASGSSSAIVSGATFAHNAGLDLLHVPYKSSPPALNDVMGGRVSMMFVDVLTGLPHVQGNALRALAVTTKDRTPLIPSLPSMQEAGVPDFDISSWQGYFGPAGMPKEIVIRLNAEIRKIVEKPEIRTPLATLGMDAFSGTPEELGTFVNEQLMLWERLIRDAGIEKQ